MSARKATAPAAATPRFFTIAQVPDVLSVSTRTVRRWIKSGALPIHSIEGIVRVSEGDFATFLELRRDARIMKPVRSTSEYGAA